MKRIQRIKEGRRARLIAEVALAKNGTPVVFSCVYRKTEQKNQYKMGWHSVTPADINVAVMRANGTLTGAQKQVSITVNALRSNMQSQNN